MTGAVTRVRREERMCPAARPSATTAATGSRPAAAERGASCTSSASETSNGSPPRPTGDLELERLEHLADDQHRPHLLQYAFPRRAPEQAESEGLLDGLAGEFDVPAAGVAPRHRRQRQHGRGEHVGPRAVKGGAVAVLRQPDGVSGTVGPVGVAPDQAVKGLVLLVVGMAHGV